MSTWPSPRVDRLGTPKTPAIHFTRAMTFVASWFTHLLRPASLLASLNGSDQISPAIGGFYIRASGGSVTLPAAGYDYNSDWTPLLAGLSPARMTTSLAAPTPSSQGTCTLYSLPVSRRFADVFRSSPESGYPGRAARGPSSFQIQHSANERPHPFRGNHGGKVCSAPTSGHRKTQSTSPKSAIASLATALHTNFFWIRFIRSCPARVRRRASRCRRRLARRLCLSKTRLAVAKPLTDPTSGRTSQGMVRFPCRRLRLPTT